MSCRLIWSRCHCNSGSVACSVHPNMQHFGRNVIVLSLGMSVCNVYHHVLWYVRVQRIVLWIRMCIMTWELLAWHSCYRTLASMFFRSLCMHPSGWSCACMVWWRCRFIRCIYAIYYLLMLLCVSLSLFISLCHLFFPHRPLRLLEGLLAPGCAKKALGHFHTFFRWKVEAATDRKRKSSPVNAIIHASFH